jgi:hypothetical protein
MEKKNFTDLNPITLELKYAKRRLGLSIAGLIIYIVALVLGFIWFDWKLILLLFLFSWGNNLGVVVQSIIPLQKQIDLLALKAVVEEEIEKSKNIIKR